MNEAERTRQERHWVEQIGLLFERSGGSRMAGRILGRLLLCDPEHQSSAELAEYLAASKASISTASRQLMQMGIVERVPVPNTRASYFRIRPHAWTLVMEARIAEVTLIERLAERGMRLLDGRPRGSTRRMREFLDLYRFMGKEMPLMLEHWRQRATDEEPR